MSSPRLSWQTTFPSICSVSLLAVFFASPYLFSLQPKLDYTAKKVLLSQPIPRTTPKDSELAREIDRAIDESDLAQARWGVFVMSLSDGRVIYSRNGDKLFTPASNMKIYTTAAALDLLGADYRWRTSAYADKQPDSNGVIDGDVTLYGRGAPDLDSSRKNGLPGLALELWEHGVRHVRGNIIGDKGFVHLTNNTTTSERDAATTIGINRNLSDNELRVWGEFPAGGRSFS